MRQPHILLYILTSVLLTGCSYKTYQPVAFSDLDKGKNIVEEKKGYTVQLPAEEKLVLNDQMVVKAEKLFVPTQSREIYKVVEQKTLPIYLIGI